MNQLLSRLTLPKILISLIVVAILVSLVILSVTYLYPRIPFSSGSKILTISQVNGFKVKTLNRRDFEIFLEERGLFQNAQFFGAAPTNTKIDRLVIELSPFEQDKQVIQWDYEGKTRNAMSSGWDYNNGKLTLRIYITNDSYGLQSKNRDHLLNTQILKSIFQITWQPDKHEEAIVLADKLVTEMRKNNNYWFTVE